MACSIRSRRRRRSDSDNDILLLEAPPAHMRKPRSNEDAPIFVDSSDDEVAGLLHVAGPSGKERASTSVIDVEGVTRSQRYVAPPRRPKTANATVGSSRVPANLIDLTALDNVAVLPEPEPPILIKAKYLVPTVLEVLPDADPAWVEEQLEQFIQELKDSATPGQDAIDRIIDFAFETGEYHKVGDAQAKDEKAPDYGDPNYHRAERSGYAYITEAMDALLNVFPTIPVPHIRATFTESGSQLIPAYNVLHRQRMDANKPYNELKVKRRSKGKEPARQDPGAGPPEDVPGLIEARKEREFLNDLMAQALEKQREEEAAAEEKEKAKVSYEKRKADAQRTGDAVECGCCFDREAPIDIAECPNGHHFCHECIRAYAESKLGEQVLSIHCMDTSGCQELFSEQTLALILSAKTLKLYYRLQQAQQLEHAGLAGLESCPFCPFAMVIENDNEKLFGCLNPECSKVSCRKCRRLSHIPRRCEEVEADLKLNRRHAVEEAMSEAAMRKCPKCKQPYVKDMGCNKIICHKCGAISCYICQQQIKGYGHFNDPSHGGQQTNPCVLWDRQEAANEGARIAQARDAAAARAREEAANQGLELGADDLHVAAPEPLAGPTVRQLAYAQAMERIQVPGVGYPADPMAALGAQGLLHPVHPLRVAPVLPPRRVGAVGIDPNAANANYLVGLPPLPRPPGMPLMPQLPFPEIPIPGPRFHADHPVARLPAPLVPVPAPAPAARRRRVRVRRPVAFGDDAYNPRGDEDDDDDD